MRRALKRRAVPPAPHRDRAAWRQFWRAHAGTMLAGDFFHAGGAVTLNRRCVFVVIEIGARHVPVPGVTARPGGPWTAPAARNLPVDLGGHAGRCRFVIGDRAGQFTAASGTVRSGAGIDVVTIPPPSPPANACAGGWARAVRADVTGRMLIAGPRHLRLVPGQYAAHDHRHRPHRRRGLRSPDWDDGTQASGIAAAAAIRRHTVIGGLISEDPRAA